MATLTYTYAESTAVLGPLATQAEPHTYDLCEHHAQTLTVPVGWQIVRLQTSFEPAPPSADDLLALVDAVREAARSQRTRTPQARAAWKDGSEAPGERRTSPARPELGPWARHAASSQDTAVSAEQGTRNPLDPTSPWAQRRARFTVVTTEDGGGAPGSDPEDASS